MEINYIDESIFELLKKDFRNLDVYERYSIKEEMQEILEKGETVLARGVGYIKLKKILELQIKNNIYKFYLVPEEIFVIKKFKRFMFIKFFMQVNHVYTSKNRLPNYELYDYIKELLIKNNINDVDRFKLYKQLHIPNHYFEGD